MSDKPLHGSDLEIPRPFSEGSLGPLRPRQEGYNPNAKSNQNSQDKTAAN
jgi:hypothetical protein